MERSFQQVTRQVARTLTLCLFCVVPVAGMSSPIGIDVLSETHRIWGETASWDGLDSLGFDSRRAAYDISSSHGPIEFRAEGSALLYENGSTSYSGPINPESKAGNFFVEAYSDRGWALGQFPKAGAQSRYLFSPRYNSLALDVAASWGGGFDDGVWIWGDIRIILTDLTENRVMYSQGVFDFWCWAIDSSCDTREPRNYSSQELFDANPSNQYALDLFALSSGDWGPPGSPRWRLSGTPSSVAVSEPGSIGLLLGGMLALLYLRSRRRKWKPAA